MLYLLAAETQDGHAGLIDIRALYFPLLLVGRPAFVPCKSASG
jgi:hypothetical protein